MSLISGIQFITHWKGFLYSIIACFSLRYLLSLNEHWNWIKYRKIFFLLWREFYVCVFTYSIKLLMFWGEKGYVLVDKLSATENKNINGAVSCCFSTNFPQTHICAHCDRYNEEKTLQKGKFFLASPTWNSFTKNFVRTY